MGSPCPLGFWKPQGRGEPVGFQKALTLRAHSLRQEKQRTGGVDHCAQSLKLVHLPHTSNTPGPPSAP